MMRPNPRHVLTTIMLAFTLTAVTSAQTNLTEQRNNLLNQIREDPGNTDLHYQLGSLELFSFQNPDAAAFHYATASTTGVRYDTLHNEAAAHAQAGRYEQAIELLNQALEEPTSPQNHATTLEFLGDVLHTAENYETAATVYAELHELTSNPEAHYKHLRSRFANGETSTLTVPLQELRHAVSPHASELLALIYQTAGMTDYAIDELNLTREEAIATGDLNTLARVSTNLAQLHYANNDLEAALDAISDVHLITSDQNTSYTEGVLRLSNGQPAEAFVAFTRDLEPEELTVERQLGAIIAAASTLDAAAANRYARLLMTGDSLEQLSVTPLARTAALAALETLHYAGDAQTADVFAGSLDLRAFTPDELLHLGTLHYERGNYANAQEVFLILEGHPDATPAEQLAATRNQAHALQANKQFASAVPLYREYLAAASYDTEVLYHLGWALFQTDNASGARDAWQQARSRGYEPAAEALKYLNN